LLVKVIVSGLVIGAINLVAQRSPTLGGWLAALPLLTFMSITWLWVDGRDNTAIGGLVTGVLWGLIPNAVMLVVLLVCLRYGLHVFASMGVSALVWACFTLAARQIGVFD
jgi:hypothetical protein